MQIFTPMNENYRRLKFNLKNVKVLSGNLDQRGIGKHAIVEIKDQKYNVYGRSCGLPHCQCDAQIKPI